jgi:hypothetical protein
MNTVYDQNPKLVKCNNALGERKVARKISGAHFGVETDGREGEQTPQDQKARAARSDTRE